MVQENGKQQIILAIRSLNRSASEEFLLQFTEMDLREYLGNLRGSNRSYRTLAEAPSARQAVALA